MTTNITDQPDAVRAMSGGGSWVADGRKPASRLRGTKRRRSVPHLLLGVLLVLACAAGFLLVSVNAGQREPVLALARPVTVGHVLSAQDLRQVNIAVDPGVSVVDAGRAPTVVGRTMSTNLPAGALLSPEMVGGGGTPADGQAIAALSLAPGRFPSEVSPGARVSVVFVPGQTGDSLDSPPTPDSTTWSAVVTSVASPPNQQTTVVSVQLGEDAARQVAAAPEGQLSIVLLSKGGG